jgi:iron complex transport system ATP-binding protein
MSAIVHAPSRTAVAARGVTYDIGPATILDGVDLDVRGGEVLAIVGPNGAGKSTLLGILAGDLAPTTGEVTWEDGQPLASIKLTELARRRAVLLQDTFVTFPFSVDDVVRMGRNPWRGTDLEADDDAIVAQSMSQTEVAHLGERLYPTLSGGERARVALARVLAQRPALAQPDEPTAALDIRHQEAVLELARSLATQGDAVAVVLHDLSLAAAWSDRVAILSEGRVAGVGAPAEVLTGPLLTRVYRHPIEVVPHPRGGAPLVIPIRQGGAR